ncbi:hypothetical protein KKG22_03700 [Patescibacteria group bacterium]|nr:hypothetical protein [Patescibacteria group bacterium]MBU1721251.1 hypothetical protein [Patescibacteria group bacterium]MBU1901041.1 hypothetical protein [Patescibacteria group bacterium]
MKYIISVFSFFLIPATVYAQYGLNETAGGTGLKNSKTVELLAGGIVGSILSIIGILFFILMVYGGFLWMTARGDEGQVEKGKDTIIAAIIGMAIVLASYAITVFVFSGLV